MNEIKCDEKIIGEITGITKYGIFVKISDNYTGMIHISEISDRFINDLEKMYVLGETIEAKVVSIDKEKKQVKLSIKDVEANMKKRKPIKEEGRGFEPLKENLDSWVTEKLEDLKKISK